MDTFHLKNESVFHAENEEPVPCGIQKTDGCAGAARTPQAYRAHASYWVYEYHAAQHTPVVHKRLAVRLWEKGTSLSICVSFNQYRSLMSPLRFRSRESRSAAEINAS
ncbi:hypothetical protein SAMN04488036_10248 [Shimia haliotis]|uniref:Uncharacterized protein n=1 Tax=Shimia haliotis TaxID=1280847 RepID=A0A1I4C4M3_9RHOB|nr:hypothetical protein SAMN04488036_10248 [Shimia haliotis]